MLLRQVIGNVFRRLRRERGITLRELAEQAQVSVPYLSEIERGRKEPSSEILAAICRALDLELADLLTEVQFDLATAVRATLPLRLQTTSIQVTESAPQRVASSPSAYSATAQVFALVA
ncbi:helix-turn-helix transcriptional regulator [Kribbella sp. NPDC056861]|uniref:helix-turn-helix domain-containing protein n=1 Tax=Kribbella sp. NPDC056861 TaxID=3154857 RepID=UPI0034217B1C